MELLKFIKENADWEELIYRTRKEAKSVLDKWVKERYGDKK